MSNDCYSLTARARYVVLTTAFLGWFFAGMVMSTSTLAMRAAAINLLANAGVIDLENFQAFNVALQKQKNKTEQASVLSEDEQNHLNAWRQQAQSWFGYYQCAILLGTSAGGLLLGRFGDRF